jgi:hypothetical protein
MAVATINNPDTVPRLITPEHDGLTESVLLNRLVEALLERAAHQGITGRIWVRYEELRDHRSGL